MPYLSAPIQMSAARRWASRPARPGEPMDFIIALIAISPALLGAGTVIVDRALSEPTPQAQEDR